MTIKQIIQNKTISIYKSFKLLMSFAILMPSIKSKMDDKAKPAKARPNNTNSLLSKFKNSHEPEPKNIAENSVNIDFKKPILSFISSIFATIFLFENHIKTSLKGVKNAYKTPYFKAM